MAVNPKVGEQIVRGTAVMPAGTGKKVIVAVLCPEGYEQAAKEAGADMVDTNLIM
jgi:large subunit ribosomal protein L1